MMKMRLGQKKLWIENFWLTHKRRNAMDKMQRRKFLIVYWIGYISLFVAVFSVIGYIFWRTDKSFICTTDGLTQQYSALLYFKHWEQDIINTLINEHRLVVKLWDECIGYGADVFTNVFCFDFTITPLELLAPLCPDCYLEYLYDMTVALRIMASGAAFSLYCFRHTRSRIAILGSSMAYCFCGFVLMKSFQSTFFLVGMVFFPLMCWAVDRIIIENKSALAFILITAYAGMTNFYFFYMLVIGVAGYIILQIFFSQSSRRSKFKMLLLFGAYGLTAIMIAAVALLPIIYQLLGSQRMGNSEIPVLYTVKYYCELLFGCMSTRFSQFDTRTAYAAPVILSAFMLLVSKNHKKLKIAFVLSSLMLCIPLVGSLMNGFGYVSNRWIFMYSFLLCYINARLLPEYTAMLSEIKRRVVLLLLLMGYFLLSVIAVLLGYIDGQYIYWQIGVLIVVSLLIYALCELGKSRFIQYISSAATLICIVINIWIYFSPAWMGACGAFEKRGEAYHIYTDKLNSNTFKQSDISDQFRCKNDGDAMNSYMIQGLKGTQFYYSTVVPSLNNLMNDMEYNNFMEHQFTGFDDRMILECLQGIRYRLSDGKIIEAEEALPLAYTYTKEISREHYEALSVEEKQEAMMYGAIVENVSLEEAEYNSSIQILYEGKLDELADDIDDIDSGREITFELDHGIDEPAEIYVIVEGLEFAGKSNSEVYKDHWEELDYNAQLTVTSALRTDQEPTHTAIQITLGENSGEINYDTPITKLYASRHNFLCNLGVMDTLQDKQIVTLKLTKCGNYHADSIRVVAEPIGTIKNGLNALKQNDTMDINFDTNKIEGRINARGKELLCITIPYSVGWTAYVDGSRTEIKKVNTAFCGIELDEGEHIIEMRYMTPMLIPGICISLLGIAILIFYRLIIFRHTADFR